MGCVLIQRPDGEFARIVCSQSIVFEIGGIDWLARSCRRFEFDGKVCRKKSKLPPTAVSQALTEEWRRGLGPYSRRRKCFFGR